MKIRTIVFLFLCFPLWLLSCKGKEVKEEKALTVKVAKATVTHDAAGKEFPFIARPFRSTELSFRVGGPLDRLEMYAGNAYRQGSIIAEISPRDFQIRRERAEAVYKQAKAEYERIQVLFEKNNISASAYEKAKADHVTAKMAYETTVNELADTRLVAPFNGYVGEVYVENYQDVKPAQPILSFIDLDKLRIETYVTQDIALQAQKLESVDIRFDALPDTVCRVRVTEISKATTRNNLSYLLTVLLPNPDGRFLSGMSGKMQIDLPSASAGPVLQIPQTALCHRPSVGEYVWVVENGKANRRTVKPGDLLPDGYVAIKEGLQAGESLAVTGLRFLSDGMHVEIAQNR